MFSPVTNVSFLILKLVHAAPWLIIRIISPCPSYWLKQNYTVSFYRCQFFLWERPSLMLLYLVERKNKCINKWRLHFRKEHLSRELWGTLRWLDLMMRAQMQDSCWTAGEEFMTTCWQRMGQSLCTAGTMLVIGSDFVPLPRGWLWLVEIFSTPNKLPYRQLGFFIYS